MQMRIEKQTKTIEVEMYIDGEFSVSLTELTGAIEELEDTQHGFVVLVLSNKNLAKYLENQGVISQNSRGSYAKASNYDTFAEQLNQLVYGEAL